MKWIKRTLRDRPFYVSLFILAIVAVHLSLTVLGLVPYVWSGVAAKDPAVNVTLFLGTAAAAAILAGFAGVVVVFGLTAEGDRFRIFRVSAGKSLRGNWTATSLAGFSAAGLSLLAAILAVNGPDAFAPWVFELSLLLMVHGALRTIWILRELVTVVRNQDLIWTKEQGTRQITPDSFS